MSLDKAIKHGKEHRKPYRGAKAVDPWCRNHGPDDWSMEDHLIQSMKETDKINDKLYEYYNDKGE